MKKYTLACLVIGVALSSFYFVFREKNNEDQLTTQIDIPPVQAPEELSLNKRTIQLKNDITKKMLSYRYLGMNHLPNKFAITVNNQEIPRGESVDVDVFDNRLDITYNYSFAKGLYKGTKTSSFTLDPEKDNYALTFSWKSKPKIKVQEL